MKNGKVSLRYLNVRNKFVEIAQDYEREFEEHMEEYQKAVFPSEKLKILEDALEKLIKCVAYLKKAIEVQESRQELVSDLERLFKNQALERSSIIMALAAKSKDNPAANVKELAKWIYGIADDKSRIVHIYRVVNAFADFGVLEVVKEDPLTVKVSDLYVNLLKMRFLTGIFEAAEDLIVR